MTNDYTRRDFLATATAGVALASLSSNSLAETEPDINTNLSSAFNTVQEIKPLPFDPAKLDGISEKLIRSHWENNYAGSVKALNAVKQKLAVFLEDSTLPAYIYNDLKREHLVRTGSVVLHELYFANLGGSGKPDAALAKALSDAFGSLEAWEKEFKRIGAGLGGGSGWVVLGLNLHTGLLENYWQWDHATAPSSTLPILVLDMYEHSYQMDYGAAAGNYVDAFFRNIQWEVAAGRLQKALKARSVWIS
ncbi:MULTISPECIES: superoxide dismutase [Methylomonas]|uniref:superoxide dismutase n=2 Tax=Methylomonas TaxID=416 RepID=A0A140E636_9GAMM|nr:MULTISPECIES: Fe-Mn family superoxide dismutase [Methylomonas]AMK78860.1 superoxide dismutase [Methylomonas denitrificans]OAI02134.1 superoxide dismutase [Methylomonas methanica]TCV78276.1 Fe-Mn family superoxide dismutase [Methylomonas methanica]